MVVAAVKEMKSSKILILGASGMLGSALRFSIPSSCCPGHRDLDISNEEAVKSYILQEKPALVYNAAAYTDVDGCEVNKDYALEINGYAPGFIAEACSDVGAVMVHFSTDYVFDGMKSGYFENDSPNPINAYGESKLLGETLIQKNMEDFRIIRTSWLFGCNGKNFVDTILSLSQKMTEVKVVNDQTGKPTYTSDLANAALNIKNECPGIYHLTNEGICTWYEFADEFIPNAVPCTTNEFPRRAKRPQNSVLINTKTCQLRHWKEAVRDYICFKEKNL